MKIISKAADILKRNYYSLRCKGKPVWSDPSDGDIAMIKKELKKMGVKVETLSIDLSELSAFKEEFPFGDDFYGGPKERYFDEKVLEHFIGYKMAFLGMRNTEDIYLDMAAAESPWAKLLRERGVNAYAIDLKKSATYGHLDYYMVMDATKTRFEAESIGSISLHCAFEMFNGDDDIRLIPELKRILIRGGRAVIVPLYMSTRYSGFTSPDYFFKKSYHDPDALIYLAEGNSMGIPFARFYDATALTNRVLNKIDEFELKYNIYLLNNTTEINPDIYCRFVLEIIRPA